jgi:hypothetical protein
LTPLLFRTIFARVYTSRKTSNNDFCYFANLGENKAQAKNYEAIFDGEKLGETVS